MTNKNCQNIKRLPHSFYIVKVKCTFILVFIYIFMLQFNETIFNIILCTLVTKYTVTLNFIFFAYNLSSVVHSATLTQKQHINNTFLTLLRFTFPGTNFQDKEITSSNNSFFFTFSLI